MESSGASKHKASVLIEPPTAAGATKVPTTLQDQNLDEYAAQPPRVAATSLDAVPHAVSSVLTAAEQPLEPPVVWGPNGCSQSPTRLPMAPAAFSFELSPTATTSVPINAAILPFSSVKIEKEVNSSSFEELKSDDDTTSSPTTPSNTSPLPSTTFIEGDTPKPIEDAIANPSMGLTDDSTPKPSSDAIPIAGSALSYSMTSTGPSTRSVSTSPPELSYSRVMPSPPGTGLSYSQVSHGTGFSNSKTGANLGHVATGTPYASGASVISGIPSYASPANNFASSAH